MLRASQAFSQVAPVPDFSLGYACQRFVFPCRTSPSLTSFSGCGHGWLFPVCAHRWFFPKCACRWLFLAARTIRRWFRFQVALVADFFQVEPVANFIASSHESVADFFFILRRSLTFFTGCAHRRFFNSCCAHRRFFPRSRQSLTFP